MDEKLKYFKLAKELNDKYKDVFTKPEDEAHLRGNIKSMSLISLSKDRPELGFSNLKTEKTITDKLKKLKEIELGRATPEKVLQSWIIKNSIQNNHTLPFGNNIKFITSEMAIVNDNKRIVNDILGFCNGSLYVIELKSDRAMNRLIEQVNNFEKVITSDINLFDDLCKIHGCKWDKKTIIKVIVWPYSKNGKKSSKILLDKEIIEYGYEEVNDSFRFIKYAN